MNQVKDGYYNGVITDADVIKSRFAKEGENRMEVELTCAAKDDAGNEIATGILCYLELSADYPKFGDTSKPFWQQTFDRLHAMGFTGQDLTTIKAQMTGKPCRLNYRTVDQNGQPLKNPGWFLSSERERVVINGAAANAALAQMMTGGGFAPGYGAATNTAAPAAAPNPFNA